MARHVVRPSPVPLGTGLRLFRWNLLAWLAVVAVGLLAVDYAVSLYQRDVIEQRQKAKARLERVALFNLRADVADLTDELKGAYRLTIYLDNPFPEVPLYVMAPKVQAYVQVGTLWKEVPSRFAAGQEGSVLKLAGRRTFDYLFEPNTKEFEELIFGYMHVRFTNVMLVSQRSQPKDDLVERLDNYYVYLKPHGLSDREILKKNQFPGGKVPLWIPMPPH